MKKKIKDVSSSIKKNKLRNFFLRESKGVSEFVLNNCKKFTKMTTFSDSFNEYSRIPEWANFFIKIGFGWPDYESRKRRIALVSMPCDSEAAGLISLGALIRDLKNPKANALNGHLESIRNYAKQYLNLCRDCQLKSCNPELKNCGYLKESTGLLKHNNERKNYRISKETRLKSITNPQTPKEFLEFHTNRSWLYVEHKNSSIPIEDFIETEESDVSKKNKCILNWHISDEPPVYLEEFEGELSEEIYSQIVDGEILSEDNLKRSYSGLCLAGRLSGESKMKELCEAIKIGNYKLSELLTIKGWSGISPISRMTFFNSRTEAADRSINNTNLVVADGDDCFLKILRQNEFQNSDIIGVIHRNISREKLEELYGKLSSLNQWYSNDLEILSRFNSIPYGISINVQKRNN